MELKDFTELVNHKLITDVTYYDYYKKNESELTNLSMEEIAQRGFVAQPASSVELVEKGIAVLPNNTIETAADFLAELKTNGYIKLNSDVNLNGPIIWEEGEAIVDLNGHNIKVDAFAESNGEILEGNSDSFAFWVKGGKFTVNGKGSIETAAVKYSINVWAQGGEVYLNGGKYMNTGEGSDLIYASGTGKIYISGGEFIPCIKQDGVPGTANKYTALNIKDRDRDNCVIEVTGGKFHNFNPADNLSENPKMNFVAEGYESVETEPGIFEIQKVEIVVDEQ